MAEEIDRIAPIGGASTADRSPSEGPHDPPPAPPRPVEARRSSPSAASAAEPTVPARPPTMQEALDQINALLGPVDRVMQLRIDPGTGITVATISNATTGQVLQQIPSSDLIRLAEMLRGWSGGQNVLVDLIA